MNVCFCLRLLLKVNRCDGSCRVTHMLPLVEILYVILNDNQPMAGQKLPSHLRYSMNVNITQHWQYKSGLNHSQTSTTKQVSIDEFCLF